MADQRNTKNSVYIPIHASKSVNKGNNIRNDYSELYLTKKMSPLPEDVFPSNPPPVVPVT